MSNIQYGILLMIIPLVQKEGSSWEGVVFFAGLATSIYGFYNGN